MKFSKLRLFTGILGFLLIGFSFQSKAQSKRAVFKLYNQALDLTNSGEYDQAISRLNQVINKAGQLEDGKGKDVMNRSKKKIPQVHYQWAIQKYKKFQSDQSAANVDAAIEQFQKTEDVSSEFGDDKRAKKAHGIITKLMYQKSLVQYQQSNLKGALATLDNVIERNANYSKAYYQKGIVMKNMDAKNFEESITLFDKAIEVGKKTGDNQIAKQAREAARNLLVVTGANATEDERYSKSIDLLERALTYDSKSAKAHYRLAEVYNKSQQWSKAASNAKKGLDYENGGKTDKAKIYYELGTAYQGMGQKSDACDALKNASYGQFKRKAKHTMKYELKCEGTS